MRRRRRPNVSWLPILPTGVGYDQQVQLVSISHISLTVKSNGLIDTFLQAVTYDTPPEQALASLQVQSLADYEGSAYRLRRIVGKCFLGMSQRIPDVDQSELRGAVVTAGFIVLKCNEETGNPLATADQYTPQAEDNIRDPWIWRRTWMLSNSYGNTDSNVQNTIWSEFPRTNAEYGSMSDGPHIDQKTGRVVMPDERLYFVASCYAADESPFAIPPIHDCYIEGRLDIRLVASMRKATNRRNASR